jgi:hypothetical protein
MNKDKQFVRGQALLDEIHDERIGSLRRSDAKDQAAILEDWADVAESYG